MTQRTRTSQWRAAALAAALGAYVGAELGASAASPAPASKPAAPAKLAAHHTAHHPAHNPAGAAKSLAALARFANGQLGDSAYDRRVAAALARFTRGKEIARRIVAPYEAMSAAERAVHFNEVTGLDVLTTRGFDRADFDRCRGALAEAAAARAQLVTRTVLARDPVDPKERSQYELVYRGMKVSKGADSDGTDEPVAFTAVFWPGGPADPDRSATRSLPESGTLGVANGASSGASAGEVWSSGSWPGAWNSGIVFLSAVIEDNGDLDSARRSSPSCSRSPSPRPARTTTPTAWPCCGVSSRTRSTSCTSPTTSCGTPGRSRCERSAAPSTSSCTASLASRAPSRTSWR